MVKPIKPGLDTVFFALADPSRRRILEHLARDDCHVGDLARLFAFSLPALSKHLRVLERANLLHQQREGKARRCRLNRAPLEPARQWLIQRQADDSRIRAESVAATPTVGVQLPEFD